MRERTKMNITAQTHASDPMINGKWHFTLPEISEIRSNAVYHNEYAIDDFFVLEADNRFYAIGGGSLTNGESWDVNDIDAYPTFALACEAADTYYRLSLVEDAPNILDTCDR